MNHPLSIHNKAVPLLIPSPCCNHYACQGDCTACTTCDLTDPEPAAT